MPSLEVKSYLPKDIAIIRQQAPHIAIKLEAGPPPEVKPVTFNLVVESIIRGDFSELDPRTRRIIDRRVALAVPLSILTKEAKVTTTAGVSRIFRVGMGHLLKRLPEDVQAQLLEQRVIDIGLAHPHSEDTKTRIGQTAEKRWASKKFKKAVKGARRRTLRKQQQAGEIADSQLEQYAPWLGGFFEIGGSMGISRGVKKSLSSSGEILLYPQMTPFIKFIEKDKARVATFKNLFGGSIYPYHNSWLLLIRNERAVLLTSIMSPYAPSRLPFTRAILGWDHHSLEEKEQIAKNTKGYHKNVHLTEDDYNDLVRNPKFLAGLIDNRGIPNDHDYPNLSVPSRNRPLLDSLYGIFRGHIEIDRRLENESKFFNIPADRLNGTVSWQLGKAETKKIFAATRPYHLLQSEKVDGFLDA